MKYKISILLFPLLLSIVPSNAQRAEKTLVKSFNLNGQNAVLIDLDGTVTVNTWNEPQMRIQMTITLQNGSEPMLKSLVTSGRYNLNSKEVKGAFSIVAPGLERQIKLANGQLLGEQVTYSVFAPKDVSITTRDEQGTGQVGTTVTSF